MLYNSSITTVQCFGHSSLADFIVNMWSEGLEYEIRKI